MRNKLLLTTAVLMAGIAIASAQENQGDNAQRRTQGPAAQHEQTQRPEGGNAQQNDEKRQGTENRQVQERQPSRNDTQGQRDRTGQASPDQREQNQRDRQGSGQNSRESRPAQNRTGQNAGDRAQDHQGQTQERQGQAQEGNRGRETTGQREQAQQTGQNPQGQDNRGQAQGENRGPAHGQAGDNRQGSVTLTSEQRTRIRDTVINNRNVPRDDNVNFSLSMGTVVPGSVRVVEVPPTLIDIHPEWRGDSYFVVRDEILIIDHDHRIVAAVPTGQPSASLEERGAGFGGSQAEIRQAQIALNREGFNVGEPDGIMGPRTKEAVMEFQKQKGFRATGEIDRDTFMGLNGQGGTQGGGARQQESSNRQGTSGGDRAPNNPRQNDRNEPNTGGRSPAPAPSKEGQSTSTGQGTR